MITIFHGDDQTKSRQAYSDLIDSVTNSEALRLDSKNIDLNQINNFINGGSLFPGAKIISISNYFSIPKANLDKLSKLLLDSKLDVVIWQDKALNVTQTNTFPQARIIGFKADNHLFACINAIKPKNLDRFMTLFDKIVEDNLFDLFLYLLKGNFRRQLQTHSPFDQKAVLKSYLQIIELEFRYKTGQLSLPKELALKRVVIPLLK